MILLCLFLNSLRYRISAGLPYFKIFSQMNAQSKGTQVLDHVPAVLDAKRREEAARNLAACDGDMRIGERRRRETPKYTDNSAAQREDAMGIFHKGLPTLRWGTRARAGVRVIRSKRPVTEKNRATR